MRTKLQYTQHKFYDVGDPLSCGEETRVRRDAVAANEKFAALMVRAGHKPRVVGVDPTRPMPRFVHFSRTPLTASPANLCAEIGGPAGNRFR